MDINDFLQNGVTVKNPNYKKPTKRDPSGSPRFLQSGNYDDAVDRGTRVGNLLGEASYDLTHLNNDANHYADYDVRINPVNTQEELNLARAKNQSAWEQTTRSLTQMGLNEVVLGTALGLSNLVDMAANIGKEKGADDYTNPFSKFLEDKQEEVRNEFAIYQEKPEESFQLKDFGWWANNAVSVASSLSMLIPSMAVTKGLSVAGKFAKLEKVSLGMAKAAKAANMTKGANTLAAAINSGAEIGTAALLSRTMEGYLEARGVYKETYDKSLDRLTNMSIDEKAKLFKNNPDFTGKSDEEIAQYMSSTSADETFKNDYAMLLFDIAQFKALGSMWKGMANKAVNSELRTLNKAAINSLAGEAEAVNAGVGFLAKRKEILTNALKNPLTSIEAIQLSEGLEEGFQGVQTEKGKEVAEKMFDPEFDSRSLESYLTDSHVWEQAFWGIMGGVAFQAAGTALGNASKAVKGKINKATMTEQEYALSQMTDEKIREQEIVSRKARMQNFTESMQLLNQGKNPFGYKLDPDTKQPIIADGNKVNEDVDADEAEMLKTKLTNDFVANMVLDATDKGNYDLFREYISDNNFNKFFKDAGLESTSGDKNFSKMLVDKMDKVYDEYNGALYDVLNSVEVENENVAKIVARNIARTKIEIDDLYDHSNDLADRIYTDEEYNEFNNYEDNQRVKYVKDRLAEIDKSEAKLQQLLDSKSISPQAAEQVRKENNVRRNQLLAFGSTNNLFGNPEVVETILKGNINDANTNQFLNEFNKYIQENEANIFGEQGSSNASGLPKKVIQDLVKKKIELDDHISYLDGTLPSSQANYQKEYDTIAMHVDRLTTERYNKAVDIVGDYLESNDNLDEAYDNIMSNNVPANVKDQLDILKLGHHTTAQYTSQINAIIKQLLKNRDTAAQEAKVVNVDGNQTKVTKAETQVAEVNQVVSDTEQEEADDNDSSTGEVQQSNPVPTTIPEPAVPEPVLTIDELNKTIETIDKSPEAIQQQIADDFTLDNDARAVGLASSITFNLFKTSRNLFDNLEGKDVNSAEVNNIVDIVADELFAQGVSRGYVDQAAREGIKLAMNTIYRRLTSKGMSGADKFKVLADQLATKQKVDIVENDGKASTTKLIPDTEFNQVVDDFIETYITNKGIYTTKGSKTIINIEDVFKEILNNDGITFEQAKHIFYNIADYIKSPNNKYIFINKTELNKNLKTPSVFFNNLINNKSTNEVVDSYMHIAAPTNLPDGYSKAIAEAGNGEPVTVSYYQGEFGSSTNSLSIKRDNVEIGYLGAVSVNSTNTGYSLKTQNKGFVYNLNNNNGLIQSNLDKFFVPLINRETPQYSELMDIAYKQFAYEVGNNNRSSSPEVTNEEIEKVMNNPAVKQLIASGDIKFDKYKVTNTQKAKYVLNAINNIIFYDVSAITTPMILESYNYWKSSTYNNYVNTHKLQLALNKSKKITTKLVNLSAGKLLIDANNKDINTIGFTYEKNPIIIVDANGNIINERNNTSYSNVAGFESGTMGMLVSDNPNAPIMALFTEANKLSDNKELSNRVYTEVLDLLNKFQDRSINFDTIATSLSNLFSGPGVKSNNLFSGYSVIRMNDKIALNIQGRKGEYNLIIHKFEKGGNKEGTGLTYIPNGDRTKSKSSIKTNKELNKTIAKEIISNLKFNKTFYAINNKNVDNDKSNQYFYKENGKLVVNIAGKADVYDSFGHFVLTNNAFKTNQGVNKEGGYFDSTDKIKSLYINTVITNSPVEESQSSDLNQTAADMIKTATMTKSVSTSALLNKAGVASDVVDVLTGTNQFNIELIPKESYFDSKATKAEAYYSKGKMFFTTKGSTNIIKSPNNLVRLLIHENLHAKFEEQKLFQQDGIVDDLMGTYRAFIEALNVAEDSPEVKRIRDWVAANQFNPIAYFTTLSAEQQRVWEKRTQEARNRQFAEEWLVESLTQPAIMRYLNNTIYNGDDVSVEGIDNSAKTIWQRIVDVLLRLFNKNSGNIKNNTILAQQYSILGNRTEAVVNTEQAVEKVDAENTPGETPIIVTPVDDTSFDDIADTLDEESDIDDLDFAVTNMIEDSPFSVKVGVEEIYSNNKELNSIGNKTQYSKYIESIFPDSINKEIFYHNTTNIDTFNNGFSSEYIGQKHALSTNDKETKPIYFTSDKTYLNRNYQIPVILNLKNTGKIGTDIASLDDKKISVYKSKGFDSLSARGVKDPSFNRASLEMVFGPDALDIYYPKGDDLRDHFDKVYKQEEVLQSDLELVVFDASQIHVLGSNKDIQGFKDFVSNTNNNSFQTVDDVKIDAYVSTPNINMNGIQVVTNMNDYLRQFPEQDKPIIAKMMAANELKFRCE